MLCSANGHAPRVLLVLLCLLLAACASVSAGDGGHSAGQAGKPGAAALPSLIQLEAGFPAGTARGTSDITHDLLADVPLSLSPGASYDAGSNSLSLSPAGEASAWAVFGVAGLPTDGSRYPLRINASADSGYFIFISDFAEKRWRMLSYSAQGIYNLSGAAALVSPAGSSFVAVLAWQAQPNFAALTLTTNEDVVVPPVEHELWYYEQTNLQVDANLTAAIEHLNTAAAAGYTRVLYADTKLEFIDLASDKYLENLAAYKAAADAAGISIVPNMVSPGYANGLLLHDPNLIEGQPVVDAPFLVQNGFAGNFAGVLQNPATSIDNGDFELHNGDAFDGWNQIDGAGQSTFFDASGHDGSAGCIRFENFLAGNPESGNDRITQQIDVDPWQVYGISFWLKTDNPVPIGQLWARVFAEDDFRQLTFNTFPIASSQDWTQYHLIFNSQEKSSVLLYLGIWGGQSGRFWIDDVHIEHAGLMNLIRRPGAPFKVTNEDGSIVYTEGVDFGEVKDDGMGEADGYPGTYDLWHPAPLIQQIGGGIQIGDILKVSYYTAVFTDDLKPACALEDQAVYDIIGDVLGVINTELNPEMVFIGVDEHRAAGWSEPGFTAGKSAGASLASFTAEVDSIAKAINPAWTIVAWSDMYDPFHNATADYYLTRGGMAEAAAGLPASWDIANWHLNDFNGSDAENDRLQALQYFAGRGNRQILAGYYDDPAGYSASLTAWLDESVGQDGVYAVMYTTWGNDYSKLAEFATTVRDWEATQ
ncbi:hypothetical protein IT575_00590 [bacterium]|nr:hypothetical protein [bacterium]